MDRRTFTQSIAAGALTAASGAAFAEDDKDRWGNLTATFIYDGEPPKPIEFRIDRDRDFFKGPLFDPSLLVDKESKGIANVVVWLYVARDAKLPPLHPSSEDLVKREARMTYRNGDFDPHILLVRTKQDFVLTNPDKISYAARIDLFRNPSSHELLKTGETQRRVFENSESRPSPIASQLHPWMLSFILIKDHPYAAISQPDGKLLIENLPIGKHSFVVWHERNGVIKDVQRDGKPENWPEGRITIDIKPGDNDLGKIVFKPTERR